MAARPQEVDPGQRFAALHKRGDPLILFNIWDPGSARIVAEAGARALATGSWSVAAAFGFADGEKIPLELVLENARRIVAAVELPVSIDFEGAYATSPAGVGGNTRRLCDTGAVGCNFEDGKIGSDGIHATDDQCARIAAMRAAAGTSFFINARTDLFLQGGAPAEVLMEEALERARAYAGAGASGFFVPGLADPVLIGRLCTACPLPVNIYMSAQTPSVADLARLGVARLSHGPGPYREMMGALRQAAQTVFGTES